MAVGIEVLGKLISQGTELLAVEAVVAFSSMEVMAFSCSFSLSGRSVTDDIKKSSSENTLGL